MSLWNCCKPYSEERIARDASQEGIEALAFQHGLEVMQRNGCSGCQVALAQLEVPQLFWCQKFAPRHTRDTGLL